jgi:hypothetical protein
MLSTYGRHALATALVVVGLVACSSSKPHASTPETTVAASSRATFHGEASWRKGKTGLVGSYTVKYAPIDPRRASCSQLVHPSASGASFSVPFPTTLGAFRVDAAATESPFTGPGTYGPERFEGLRVTLTQKGAKATSFVPGKGTTVKLALAGDGSGTFEFANLTSAASGSLSGASRWTCS